MTSTLASNSATSSESTTPSASTSSRPTLQSRPRGFSDLVFPRPELPSQAAANLQPTHLSSDKTVRLLLGGNLRDRQNEHEIDKTKWSIEQYAEEEDAVINGRSEIVLWGFELPASQQTLARTRLLSYKIPLLPILVIPPSEMHKRTGAAVDALMCQLKAAGVRFVKFDQDRIPVIEEGRDVTETLQQVVKGNTFEEKVVRIREEGIRLWSEWMEVDMAAKGVWDDLERDVDQSGVASFHLSRHDQERWLDFSRRVAERRTELLSAGDDDLTQSRTMASNTQENWREVVERWRRAGGSMLPKSEQDNWSSQEDGAISDLSSLTRDPQDEEKEEYAYLEDLYLDPFHVPSLLRLGLNIFTSMLKRWRHMIFGGVIRQPLPRSPSRSANHSLHSTITMTKDEDEDEKSKLDQDLDPSHFLRVDAQRRVRRISLTGTFLACAAAYTIGWLVGSGTLERLIDACLQSRGGHSV